MRRIILASVACLVIPNFSHKRQDLPEGGVTDHKMYFLFYVHFLSEIFLILRRLQRDNVTNVHRSPRKGTIVLVRF
jgi:hypothetical protein